MKNEISVLPILTPTATAENQRHTVISIEISQNGSALSWERGHPCPHERRMARTSTLDLTQLD
jgi:hypothetical protein